MFPRRFTLPLDPKRRFAGHPHHTSLFTLIVADSSLPYPQITFIVSRKVSPSAVTRHLIKRRLAHAFKPLVVGSTPHLYLVIAHPPITQASYQEIASLAATLFQKSKSTQSVPSQK